MIARLLEGAPLQAQEEMVVAASPTVAAAMGGTDMRDAIATSMNPQHAIVTVLAAYQKFAQNGSANDQIWQQLTQQDEQAARMLMQQLDQFAQQGKLRI